MDLYKALKKEGYTYKIQKSLLKYKLRSHYRPTPFGYFAGVGVGNFAKSNHIELNQNHIKTTTSLDMHFICDFLRNIEADSIIKKHLKFQINNSFYPVGDDFRYVEYNIKNGRRSYFVSEIEGDEILKFIISTCTQGAKKIDEITELLIKEFDVKPNELKEVENYLNELIKNQVLISNLTPAVNNGDILENTLNELKEAKVNNGYFDFLREIKVLIEELDLVNLGERFEMYKEIQTKIGEFSKDNSINFNKEFYIKTDAFLKADKSELSTELIPHINEAIKFLNKITPKRSFEIINKFKREFYKRYENNFIPLTTIMDTDLGLGIGNLNAHTTDNDILVDDLFLNTKSTSKGEENYTLSKFERILYERFLKCLDEEKEEIILKEEEFIDFDEDWSDLPNTMSVFVEIIKSSREKSDNSKLIINSIHGSSALNMISRFSKLDKVIEKTIEKIVEKEEELVSKEKILAELVHLPEDRTGNIILRKVKRKYEIPYLALGTVDRDSQIEINDILVSVPNGERIILWSKKHNKEIIPIHSCAYNYKINKLPIFYFLSLVQNQGVRQSLSFNWGNFYYEEPFLPRVTYKNIILSPKIWRVKKDVSYKELLKKKEKNLKDEVFVWREKNRLPEKFLLADGDNRLLIDTNDELAIEIIFKEISKGEVILHEFFNYEGDNLICKGSTKAYRNEIIVNYYKNEKEFSTRE